MNDTEALPSNEGDIRYLYPAASTHSDMKRSSPASHCIAYPVTGTSPASTATSNDAVTRRKPSENMRDRKLKGRGWALDAMPAAVCSMDADSTDDVVNTFDEELDGEGLATPRRQSCSDTSNLVYSSNNTPLLHQTQVAACSMCDGIAECAEFTADYHSVPATPKSSGPTLDSCSSLDLQQQPPPPIFELARTSYDPASEFALNTRVRSKVLTKQ